MAFKMNREGFTFYTKEGPTKHSRYGNGPTMTDKGYPKYGRDKGLTKTMENKGYPKTIAKPDFLDADGDGDKEESMKKAFADKASKTTKEQIPNVTSNLKKTPYEKNKYSHATKTIAKDKDFNEKTKEREDPLFEGGDITPTQFKNMSIEEIKKLNPDMTIQKIRQIKNKIK
tara:strand:+ start:1447 stop:1962 length:516 start_codon:yes stop_codon:yes gene_type:complete